jgi:hypothetical protein
LQSEIKIAANKHVAELVVNGISMLGKKVYGSYFQQWTLSTMIP